MNEAQTEALIKIKAEAYGIYQTYLNDMADMAHKSGDELANSLKVSGYRSAEHYFRNTILYVHKRVEKLFRDYEAKFPM